MIKGLAKLANRLDRLGLTKEADVLDAALQKLAQQVATRGAPGATYSGGGQVSPTVPGGKRQVFYKAKPSTISEFNAFLGSLIKEFAANPTQQTFSKAIIANAPSAADTSWSLSKTQPAFEAYARAAGFPEAGTNWQDFANANEYAPNMFGIYKFWEDTIDEVEAYRGREQEEYFAKFMEQQGKALAESSQSAGATGGAAPTKPMSLGVGSEFGVPEGVFYDKDGRLNYSKHIETIQKKYNFQTLDGRTITKMKEMMRQFAGYTPNKNWPDYVWDADFDDAYTTLANVVLSKAKLNQSDPAFVEMLQGGPSVKNKKPIADLIKGLEYIASGIPGTGVSPNPEVSLKIMLDIANNPWYQKTTLTPAQIAERDKKLLADDENPFAAGATGTPAPPSYKPPVGGKPGAAKIPENSSVFDRKK